MAGARSSFTIARGEFHAYKYLTNSYEARVWLSAVLGVKLAAADLPHVLREGVELCDLVNALAPGTIAKMNRAKNAFASMERIQLFLAFCRERLGMSDDELFAASDLAEHRNLVNIVKALHSVAGKAVAAGMCTVAIESVGGTHEFTDEEVHLARITLAAEESPAPAPAAAGGEHEPALDTGDALAVAQALARILKRVGPTTTVSLLGHEFYEATGVSWRLNLKHKGFGAMPAFLASHADLFRLDGDDVTAL